MEDYAPKMSAKTDADLRRYVAEAGVYREAAVLAALAELRRRGQPAPEEEALRPALEAAGAAERAAETAASAAGASRPAGAGPLPADAAGGGPVLYSPATIVIFSLLFSMLAGGALLGLNFGRLRRWGALAALGVFLAAYLVGCTAVLAWAAARIGLSPLLSLAFNVPAIVAYVAFFWPRYLGAQPYRSRGWVLPLLACVLVAVGLQAGSKYLMARQPAAVRAQMEQLLVK